MVKMKYMKILLIISLLLLTACTTIIDENFTCKSISANECNTIYAQYKIFEKLEENKTVKIYDSANDEYVELNISGS